MNYSDKSHVIVTVAAVTALCAIGPHAYATPVDWLQDIRAGQTKTIVTMGTSLTALQPNWVPQITAWLKGEAPDAANVNVVNVGVSSASSTNANPALSGIQTQLPNALAQNPDVVFIEFAVNDAYTPYGISPATSVANLNSMITSLKAQNANVKIVPMTMNNTIGDSLASRPNIASYYHGYRTEAQNQNLTLIDSEPEWTALYGNDVTTWNSYVPDGLHPNALGAARITTPEIRRTLAGEVPFAVGGFESIPFAGNFAFAAHNSGIGVWGVTGSASSGNAVVLWSADALNGSFPNINASEGASMVTLQADNQLGVITQEFDTLVGQQYQVFFDHSILSGGNVLGAQDLTLRVSATGNAAQDYTRTSDGSVTSATATWNTLPYTTESYVFTATSSTTLLTFANLTLYGGTQNFGTTIDNIRVNAVPEPSSLILLLFGSTILWMVGRKRS